MFTSLDVWACLKVMPSKVKDKENTSNGASKCQ